MASKPRSDAKLKSLPPHYKQKLISWLVDDNLSYADARARLAKEFSVHTSVGALSQFYATECFALRSSEAKAFAEEAVKQVKAREDLDEATLLLVSQRAFEQAYARKGDLDALAVLSKILGDSAKLKLKQKDQALAERRIAILEKKAALADQAEKVTRDASLTPEQRQARMKEIFQL
jgi:hypothetical protein